MTHELSASQARTVTYTDLVVHNEVDTITRQIIADAGNGLNQSTVNDGTTMTESTPTITVTSSGYADGWTGGNTLLIAGTTVTLSSGVNDGTNIVQATADINAAGIAGLTATNDGSEITLSYEPPMASWSLVLAEGTGGLAELGFAAATTTATNPDSVDYYNAWTGAVDDRAISTKMTQVINHFQNLGYNILRKKNVTTGNTFFWEVYW